MKKRKENWLTWALTGILFLSFMVTVFAFSEHRENTSAAVEAGNTGQRTDQHLITQLKPAEAAKTQLPGGASREPINILLIGQDKKPEEPGTRSDSIILCTVCPDTKTMVLTSIMRDLYVEIPGYEKNRINAAYSFGGADLLERVLSDSLAVQVQGHIEVDFSQFVSLVDLLGGVPMELREDEAWEINRVLPYSNLHGGTAILNGEQALAYSRIRSLDLDADASRTLRQRKILEKIYLQYKTASPREWIRAMQKALPMLSTNLSSRDFLYYAGLLLPLMKDLRIISYRIPAEGTYEDIIVRGMAVLDADLQENRRLLDDIMGGK